MLLYIWRSTFILKIYQILNGKAPHNYYLNIYDFSPLRIIFIESV